MNGRCGEKLNLSRRDLGKPKAVTNQNEMGIIREIWKWGMENGFITFSPKLPFHGENLITDDKVRRDTWEAHEWLKTTREERSKLLLGCPMWQIKYFSFSLIMGCVWGGNKGKEERYSVLLT